MIIGIIGLARLLFGPLFLNAAAERGANFQFSEDEHCASDEQANVLDGGAL